MGMRKVISICADDFGQDQAIDSSIVELLASKSLSGTSCLVDGRSFQVSAASLRQAPGQKGLHLNFTERLTDSSQAIWPLKKLIVLAYLRRLPIEKIKASIAHQLDLFERHMQQVPDYIDGHQHVHQLPQIRELLLAQIEQRYAANPPWLRYTGAERINTPDGRSKATLKPRIIAALGATELARLAIAKRVTMNAAFTGVYDFSGGREAYAQWVQYWFSLMQHGDTMMCHPATQSVEGDVLGAQRVAEYEVLKSAQMRQWLAQHELTLA